MIRRALTLLAIAAVTGVSATQSLAAPGARAPEPVLAYYYIWFDHTSWQRAKIDFPQLGRYSSDDTSVLSRHVKLARSAGITGFLVSWKSTPTLDRRLAKLVAVAHDTNFKLGIVYEGLDFAREPLPAARIARDLVAFADRYGDDPAFSVFGRRPLVIWAGTWRFSRAEIAHVVNATHRRLLVLASEKNASAYERIANLVNGDAYYWSSVNPKTYPGYPQKLAGMSATVHGHHGLWIAPAAPGFDARKVGGTHVVPRDGGVTLRTELDAAVASSPDAVGLISWNEFSENTYVEPSLKTGRLYLDVLGDALGAHVEVQGDFDSSDASAAGVGYGLPILSGLCGVIFAGLLVAFMRRHTRLRLPGRDHPTTTEEM